MSETTRDGSGVPSTTQEVEAARRDFLFYTAGALGAVGVGAVGWMMVDQMNPDAGTLALASIEVDLSALDPGMAITVKWRGKPVFIRRRTEEELASLEGLTSQVKAGQQVPDSERVQVGHEDTLIVVGVCTHLGCVPLGQKQTDDRGKFGGYYCPCHGSHYDASGRIIEGPAERNLDVPDYEFVSDTVVRIG